VLETACVDCEHWNHLPGGAHLEVSVNVSGVQLMDPQFVATVASVLGRTVADPGRVTLEVTEGVFLHDSEHAAAVLSELRALGVKIALDDFGTGHSPLTYLRALPVDVVKIDQGFVSRIEDPSSYSIITKVIELAHLLDLTVVSEGVETTQQHNTLTTLGSEFCQGFYFARPMARAALEALLRDPSDDSIHLPVT